MNLPQPPWFARLAIAFALVAVSSSIVFGQETAARPDRGLMPNGSYAVSDVENISLTNGNVGLRVPLASLPPVAGGKLSWTINAHYNSKIWNVTREERQGERYDLSLPPINYVVDTPQLSEQGGWRISGQYEIEIREARMDFDYQLPAVGDEPDRSLMLNSNWYHVVLRMPDGAEHELRPMDYSSFPGNKSFLYGYYSAIPDTHGTMRYYSFDGSYLYAVITSQNNWAVYLPDGTKVIQSPDGIQRIQDTNGNKIKIFSDTNGTHYQDEQTGREIRYQYFPGENNQAGQGRVYYKTVDGVDQYIAINFGITTVQGQVYKVKGWITGQMGTQPCNHNSELNAEIPVIREIVLPQSEPNITRKITFGYSSDTTETASSLNVRFGCSDPPETYVRTASKGWGFLNHIEMPSGAKIDYTYALDTWHLPMDTDDLAKVSVSQKKLEHDETIDTWTYVITENTATLTNPDSSTVVENKHPHLIEAGGALGKSGLAYRTSRPFMKTERHWTYLVFSDANVMSPNGAVDFNSVVDFEYTTLTDSAGNNLKMSAKAFQYDYNGNVVQTTEYDWFDPALVARDAQGVPTGVPAGATVLRTTNNTFYNAATSPSSTNVYAKRSLSGANPLILSALKESTTGPAVAQFSYDGNSFGTAPTAGNLTGKSVWDNVDNKWITTSSTYGLYGNLSTATDARGKVTQFFYDDSTHALPTRVVVDPQNGTGTQTTSTAFDYSTGLVVSTTDPNGNLTTIDYANPLISNQKDPFGRPGAVTGPAVDVNGASYQHHTRTFYYDSARTVQVRSDLNAQFDGLLKTETLSDMLGRPIESRQYETANDFIAVRKSYDTQNRLTKTSNPFRAGETIVWTTTLSDVAGRVISVTAPDNTAVTTSYDANQTIVTDQASKQRKSVTNALGQLTSVFEDPSGLNYQTTYDYDVFGNLSHVYQGTQTRTFTYDSLSRLRAAQNPENGTVSYSYDDNGNLIQKVDPRLLPNSQTHITTTYIYDSLNRVTSRTYNDATPAVSYLYDSTSIANGKGRLASVSSSVSTYSYAGYDAMGRVQGASQAVGGQTYTMSYAYDLAGHVIKLSYPSGRTVDSTFDDAGRLKTFTGKLGDGITRTYAHEFKYTAWNSLQQEKFGTDATLYHKQRFNVRGQLWDMRASTVSFDSDPANGDRGAIVNYYSNSFGPGASGTDNNGNLLRQESYIPGSSFYQDNFSYDALNRLTAISEKLNGAGNDTFKQSYAYDRWGNRLIDTAPNKTWGAAINVQSMEVNTSNNRLTVPAGQSGVMAYDQAGNLTTDTYTGDGSRAYDAENRMISSAGAVSATYSYDGDGRRIKRQVNNTETWQVYGPGGELLAEYAANATPASPQKEYGYRNGELLVTAEPGAAGSGNGSQNVTWTNAVGVAVSGNSLTKTAAAGWGNAGAASTQTIASGDGYAEFSSSGVTLFGLSHVDADQNYSTIDFGWHINGSDLYVFESGVQKGQFGTVTSTDRLRVAVEGGVVKYKKNGVVIYTSTVAPQYPLLADTALYTNGSTISNVVISASTQSVGWTNAAGVSVSGNSLTKTAATSWGNAGAASTQTIASGDGYAEFSSSGVTLFGLSHVDADQNYSTIDFGWHINGSDLYVFESGVNKGAFGTVSASDRLRVAVEGGVVKYKKNGVVIYTSTTTPSYPLLADTALYLNGSAISNVVISASTQSVGWTNAVGVAVSGNSLTKTAAAGWGNAGAASTQTIASGDGYAEFSASGITLFGLSHADADQNYSTIDFGWHINGSDLYVFESGVNKGAFGTVSASDRLRVAVEGGVVKYRKNGAVIYTSTATPSYPLLADTALYSNGSTISNVVIGVGGGSGAAAQLHWLVTDQLGTPRMIFDQTGSLATVSRHDYLPFGEELHAGTGGRTTAQGYGGDNVRQKFTSKERDNETGLYYFLARYYSPTQGRFTAVDPIMITQDRLFDPQRINLYTYCRNNPLAFIDPTGEEISYKDRDSETAYNEYIAYLEDCGQKCEQELATVEQLKNSEVNYIIEVGGKQQSENAEGNTAPDKEGENILVRIRNTGGPNGENFDRNGRFAHELEHARQFDSGELAFNRTKDGKWLPLQYDLYDEVKSFKAQLDVSPRAKDNQFLAALRDDRNSDENRAERIKNNGYSKLLTQASNIDYAWGAKPGQLVRPAADRPFFGRVYDPSKKK